jgi:N-methylhydantoinase A
MRKTRPTVLRGQRSVFLTKEKGWVGCNVYYRNRLPIGSSIPGPALIEEPTTTTLVLSDQRFARDETGQLIMWSP